MNLLDHDSEGATIHLEQRELLMVMALIQEGRDSFGCASQTGRDLDELFSMANVLVESARRRALGIRPLGHRMGQVADPEIAAEQVSGKKYAH